MKAHDKTFEVKESFETKLKRRALNYSLKGDVPNLHKTLKKLEMIRLFKQDEETKIKYFVAFMYDVGGHHIREFDTREAMISFVKDLNSMKDSCVLCTWTEPLK